MSLRDLGWLTSDKLAFALDPTIDEIEYDFKNLFYKHVIKSFAKIKEIYNTSEFE